MDSNYTIIYREDKLDDFIKNMTKQGREELLRGFAIVLSGDTTRGKVIIDRLLKEVKVAVYVRKGTRIYESHMCGFKRVLETIELAV